MKRLSILLLVLMVSLSSYAINEEKEKAKESRSTSFQPKPLEDDWSKWLVGEWEFSAESDAGTGKGWTKICESLTYQLTKGRHFLRTEWLMLPGETTV